MMPTPMEKFKYQSHLLSSAIDSLPAAPYNKFGFNVLDILFSVEHKAKQRT